MGINLCDKIRHLENANFVSIIIIIITTIIIHAHAWFVAHNLIKRGNTALKRIKECHVQHHGWTLRLAY